MSDVEQVVLDMWRVLSQRDWAAVKTFLAQDCIYLDMPLGAAFAARGPDDIVKRFQLGPGSVAEYENHDGLLLGNGTDVMYEHSETWVWDSGERVVLPFVSVHRVEDGKITLWKDYWDFAGLTAQAPTSWVEGLATADTSWVFDATGLI